MTITIITQEASLVEQTTLPKLTVRGKSNEPLMEAYVNAYVVGSQKEALTNGKVATPLYYLSLVAQRGQGTTLQAIFARLVNIHSRGATLDGVEDVFLAHHRQRIASNGYTVHWNFEQAEVQPERDLHAVIESNPVPKKRKKRVVVAEGQSDLWSLLGSATIEPTPVNNDDQPKKGGEFQQQSLW